LANNNLGEGREKREDAEVVLAMEGGELSENVAACRVASQRYSGGRYRPKVRKTKGSFLFLHGLN